MLTTALPAPVNIPAINANPHGGYIRPESGNRIETAQREEHRIQLSISHATPHRT